MPNYPDPIEAIIGWLALHLGAAPDGEHRRILPEQPADLHSAVERLPTTVVERVGGYDPHPGVDLVRFNTDTWATGPDPMWARAAALARAEDIRRAVRVEMPGTWLGDPDNGGIWVARTAVVAAPTIRPWDTAAPLRRAQATYQIVVHTPL